MTKSDKKNKDQSLQEDKDLSKENEKEQIPKKEESIEDKLKKAEDKHSVNAFPFFQIET